MSLDRLQRTWDELGQKDPLWAVLTWPEKKGGRWRADEFFETGVSEVEDLMAYLEKLGRAPPREKVLDFGCGVGRVTQPLAAYFDEVWGVDIAPSMIAWAEHFNGEGERCRYMVNVAEDLAVFADATFGLVYSKLTLQHLPPALAKKLIVEFVRVLHPRGVAVFQLPGEPERQRHPRVQQCRRAIRWFIPEWCIRTYRKLRYGHLIEMNGIPRDEVVSLVEANGGVALDITQDTSAGGGWTSYRYCVGRR